MALFRALLLVWVGLPLVVATADGQASQVYQKDAAALRWRVVPMEGAAPSTRLVSTGSSLQSSSPSEIRTKAEPPADAQVKAAQLRPRPLIGPSLSGGVPIGFVAGWGDYSFSASAGTPGNLRDGVPDGSVNLGLGLGDPLRSLGVEVGLGIASIKNFNANGSFNLAVGRVLVSRPDLQAAVAGGLIDAYTYGSESGKPPVNGYGVASLAIPLRKTDPEFQQILMLSAGFGGNSFAAVNNNFQTTETGFFGSAGVELSPSLGVSVGQSNRSTNINLSLIPFRTLPVFINLAAADIFASTPYGTVGVLSVGWSDSLKRPNFP